MAEKLLDPAIINFVYFLFDLYHEHVNKRPVRAVNKTSHILLIGGYSDQTNDCCHFISVESFCL